MEKERIAKRHNFTAGVIFALAAISMLIFIPKELEYYGRYESVCKLLYNFFEFGGLVVISYALIRNRKDAVILVGFGLLAVSSFLYWNPYNIWIWDISWNFSMIFKVVAWSSAVAISISSFKEQNSQGKNKLRGIWFLPICCLIVGNFLNFLSITWYYFIVVVLEIVGLIFALLWITQSGETSVKIADSQSEFNYDTEVLKSFFYCGLGKHILLLLFTFGVWHFIWIYRMTEYTNAANDEEERNPTTKLLLCLFVPFYIIYWTYKTAQRIDKMAFEKGLASNMSTLCLILEIFIPIIPPILLQDKVNAILTAKNDKVLNEIGGVKVENTTLGIADEIKKYKELVDAGIITQEEFEAKKKQLLGL